MSRRENVSLYPSVKFLRASSTLKTFTSPGKATGTSQVDRQNGAGLSGEEAKTFYEQLLEESAEEHPQYELRSHSVKPRPREADNSKKKASSRSRSQTQTQRDPKLKLKNSDSRQTNLFLKMAQEGNIDGLRGMLEDGKQDINVTDQFGWTALMCACHSQQKACVKFLLKEGARTDLCNSKGETVEDIARNLHDGSLVKDIFHKHKKRRKHEARHVSNVDATPECSFCEICNTRFTNTVAEHNSSTVHLFNCQYKSERTLYHIPESNIGFQLMTRTGWDKEKGLGPEGTGRKFPVKTLLRKDRRGLGSKQKDKARITHFSPKDPAAVEVKKHNQNKPRIAKRTSKKKIIEKQMKERKWEHDLRVYMNTE